MAKYQTEKKKEADLEICYATKEEFFVSDCDEMTFEKCGCTFKLNVVAKDDDGYYYTNKSYVGAKILDPNRMYHRREPDVLFIDLLEKQIPDTI